MILVYLFLIHSSETMIWKEKERSRIKVVQMDNLRGLLDIMRMDKVTNTRIKQLCGVMKGEYERISEGLLKEKRFGCHASKEHGASWECIARACKGGYVG